jgi:hypothetical protein
LACDQAVPQRISAISAGVLEIYLNRHFVPKADVGFKLIFAAKHV